MSALSVWENEFIDCPLKLSKSTAIQPACG
jgi:hypothetical protein